LLIIKSRHENPELAILVSCRKKINDESERRKVEKVQEIIGAETVMTGFYYGEMAPFNGYTFANCTIKQ
jgi:hypothetical protein